MVVDGVVDSYEIVVIHINYKEKTSESFQTLDDFFTQIPITCDWIARAHRKTMENMWAFVCSINIDLGNKMLVYRSVFSFELSMF